jgi:hypothetical protein
MDAVVLGNFMVTREPAEIVTLETNAAHR